MRLAVPIVELTNVPYDYAVKALDEIKTNIREALDIETVAQVIIARWKFESAMGEASE